MQRVVPSYDPYAGNAAVEPSQGGGVGGYALPNAGHEGDGRVEASMGVGVFTGGSVLPEAAGGGEDDNEGFEPMGVRNRRRRFGGGGAGEGGGEGMNAEGATPTDTSLWFDIGGNDNFADTTLVGGYWHFHVSPTSRVTETYDRVIYLVLVQGNDGNYTPATTGPGGNWVKVYTRNVSDGGGVNDSPYEVWRQEIAAGVAVPDTFWIARKQAPVAPVLLIKHEYFSLPKGTPPFLWTAEDDVFAVGYDVFGPNVVFGGIPYYVGDGVASPSNPTGFQIWP